MRYVVLSAISLTALNCRDIEPLSELQLIDGYQLNGVVTAINGMPVDSATVSLFYYYDMVGSVPTDTQQVVITDTMKVVDVSVVTIHHDFVRTLYFGRWPRTGPLPRFFWDGRDWQHKLVPSGVYLIQYYVDTAIVKYRTIIVGGHPTAVTDINGRFTLRGENLPVGERFDYYNSYDSFDAVYEISRKIGLKFQKYDRSSEIRTVLLSADKVTNSGFTF